MTKHGAIQYPFHFRYGEALNTIFADMREYRYRKSQRVPTKGRPKFYEVTYRNEHRQWVNTRMELQIEDAGNRTYEAMAMLQRLGVKATRVRVGEAVS